MVDKLKARLKAAASSKAIVVRPGEELEHSQIMVIVGALMLAMLLAALDQTIVSTALPKIAADLNGLNKLSWVATSYLITSAIVTPIYGKLGDLFGRKKIFQISILIFLFGSILCGLSQNMNQLIIFRGIQGLGGGGLISLVLAIIGDIVPPRQRGRYQGYFGAVFGLSSVAGPLLGGLFTEHLSWRWIFYINLPLGLIALAAIATRLHLHSQKLQHKIDYVGATLLSGSVISLILATVWGGVDYPWLSGQIIGLFAASVVLAAAFVWQERRAVEPIIPLRLFKNDIFSVSVLLATLTGLAMFASILYIPLYQQLVRGNTPTESGLLMIPLVLGLFGASLTSGRLISKTGRYRAFPIFGTIVLGIGMWLFSHLGANTSHVLLSVWMIVIGIGLGCLMQIPILAVQNSTERAQLGTATATVTFFRSIGSALGGAVFGTILNARFATHLQQAIPGSASVGAKGLQAGASELGSVSPAIRPEIIQAFVQSFHDMFLIGLPFVAVAFVVALLLREAPLRTSTAEVPVE